MKKNDKLPSLEELQAKINEVKSEETEKEKSSSASDMSQAMRLSIDLAAGVLVGVGAGYFLDKLLGTIPLFMIVCLFLGAAAGVKNMMLSADAIDKKLKNETGENEDKKD